MPLYEYKCKRCKKVFERLSSRQEADGSPECPDCGCARSARVMSMFAARRGGDGGGGSIGGDSCGGCKASSCGGCRR